MKLDPITFEVVKHRIWRINDGKFTSGWPPANV